MHLLATKPARLEPSARRAASFVPPSFAYVRSDEARQLWFWGPADAKGRACGGDLFGPYSTKEEAWRAAEDEGCRVNTFPLRATVGYHR
jgi:hypothetical protein